MDLPRLLEVVDGALSTFNESQTEYQLIQKLESAGLFKALNGSPNLVLFQKHFLTMHVLYQLRQRYWEAERGMLEISPLNICLRRYEKSRAQGVGAFENCIELSDYYLNIDNLFQQNSESIEALLGNFWENFSRWQSVENTEGVQALAVFDLTLPVSDEELKKRYRVKIQAAHPDHGGCSEEFIALRRSYERALAFLKQRNLGT